MEAIKTIRNMHAVSANQIADILYFNGESTNLGKGGCLLYIPLRLFERSGCFNSFRLAFTIILHF